MPQLSSPIHTNLVILCTCICNINFVNYFRHMIKGWIDNSWMFAKTWFRWQRHDTQFSYIIRMLMGFLVLVVILQLIYQRQPAFLRRFDLYIYYTNSYTSRVLLALPNRFYRSLGGKDLNEKVITSLKSCFFRRGKRHSPHAHRLHGVG